MKRLDTVKYKCQVVAGSKLAWRDRQGLRRWWSTCKDLVDVYAKGGITLGTKRKMMPWRGDGK
jgi:hypothetical protein